MQSILSGKKIEILSEVTNYKYGKQGFFNNISIIDKTKPDPYHPWAIAKNQDHFPQSDDAYLIL